MKGITPIISTVLLVLIAIVIIGLGFAFFTSLQSGAQSQGQESLANILTQITVPFAIENQIGTNFYIRNKGNTTIQAGTLSVYADGEAVDAQIPNAVQPGTVGILTVPPEVINSSSRLRIVGTIYEQTVTIKSGQIVGQW